MSSLTVERVVSADLLASVKPWVTLLVNKAVHIDVID